VQLDEGLRDRQAEAGASHSLGQSRVAAGEAVEDVLELLFRNPWPVVGNGDLDLRSARRDPYQPRSGSLAWGARQGVRRKSSGDPAGAEGIAEQRFSVQKAETLRESDL
jgi:hypothetical protein